MAHPQHSILVRASHGKQPDGWMMLPDGPKSVAEQMTRLIEEKVDNVIWEVNHRRRSDSDELLSFTDEKTRKKVIPAKKWFLLENGRLAIESLGKPEAFHG
ncbi:MAG: hypothetical protein M1839_007176 [Geoglossum umbratile]|nr:MAG: hypothetical protein M1839_007176 [Geoglossum umbratile]